MLRKGLAALMMGIICAGGVFADDSARGQQSVQNRSGIIGWFKQKTTKTGTASKAAPVKRQDAEQSAVQRAVVADAERQSAQLTVRQTASNPDDDVVVVGQGQALPIEIPPVVPNTSVVSGPQYFSANGGEQFTNPVPVYPQNNWQQYAPPVPVHANSAGRFQPISNPRMAQPVMNAPTGSVTSQNLGQYPQTGAALYPAPVPGIPQQIGGTLIPNQAFHPHEMLYAHRYRAMYPPYYYKVNGGWMVTPFGVWSHEDWKLQGTMVDVKYKSHISPFSLYHGPKGW